MALGVEELREATKTNPRGVPAEIRTEHFPDTGLDRDRYTNLVTNHYGEKKIKQEINMFT